MSHACRHSTNISVTPADPQYQPQAEWAAGHWRALPGADCAAGQPAEGAAALALPLQQAVPPFSCEAPFSGQPAI